MGEKWESIVFSALVLAACFVSSSIHVFTSFHPIMVWFAGFVTGVNSMILFEKLMDRD